MRSSLFLAGTSRRRSASTYTRTPLVAAQDIPAGFPVPIHSDMFDNGTHNNAIFSNIQSDGGDLRAFSDSSFTTQLPLELVSINTGTPSIIGFFRTTSSVTSGNTIAYLRTTVGGGQSQPSVTDTYGRNNVWQDYDLSTHDMVTDSSGNNTLSNTGGAALSGGSLLNEYPARGYGSTDGVGSTDRTTLGYTGNPTQIAVSVILYENGYGGGNFGRFLEQDGGSSVVWSTDQGNTAHQILRDHSSTGFWRVDRPTSSTWHHELISLDSSSTSNPANFYVDGVSTTLETSGAPTGTLASNTVNNWYAGNSTASDRNWDGRLGAMRVRASTLDATWAAVEDDGYRNPTGVATAGALVSV